MCRFRKCSRSRGEIQRRVGDALELLSSAQNADLRTLGLWRRLPMAEMGEQALLLALTSSHD